MNIVIVDDLSADRKKLADNIYQYSNGNSVAVSITEYVSGEDFLESSRVMNCDAAFLDIFSGELNGLEVARRIKKVNPACQIIFVSVSSAFAVQSYEVRAFYYILKPFQYEHIQNVMDMLQKNLHKSSRFIRIKEGREWRKVLLSDILYADYSNHYVQIHTENSVISTYMKFTAIEEMLIELSSEFLSCYRCIVINMTKITKVEGLFFLIKNSEYIPINRKRAKEIKAQYVDFLFNSVENNEEEKQDLEKSKKA